MKHLFSISNVFFLLILSLTPAAFAANILGVPEGVYDGNGPMKFQAFGKNVLAIGFTSHRELKDNLITAKSTAYLSPTILTNIPGLESMTSITIEAHLRIIPDARNENQFALLDVDDAEASVGSAECSANECSFKATVKKGSFHLEETWVRTDHGFSLINGYQTTKIKSLIIPAIYSGDFYTTSSSFNEIHRMVFTHPLSELPVRHGINGIRELTDALVMGIGEITDRSAATFASHADFRPPRDKLLHPVGICADARWNISEESLATGLFQKGSDVPGLIRFSTGTADSAYTKDGRIFGFALKLFPTRNADQDVETVNIQTLDTYGFDRSPRKRYFFEDQNSEGTSTPVQFTNVAPAKSIFGKTLAKFFDRFDQPNFARPVYPLSEVNDLNQAVPADQSMSPYEIRFVPHFVPEQEVSDRTKTPDFRTELLAYQPGEVVLDIEIVSFEPALGTSLLQTLPAPQKIGTLTIGNMVVSDACDWSLHFNHPKNRVIPKAPAPKLKRPIFRSAPAVDFSYEQ